MLIIDCVQKSDEWYKEKLGKPSASNASQIVTNEGNRSKSAEGYMYELAAEIITGQRVEGYQNSNMLMGNEREEESRSFYELKFDVEVKQVGVIYKDEEKKFLCSPDGIVLPPLNGHYGIEMKNVLPKTQVKYLLNNKLPSEYFSQIQFSLYVTGFERWDFMSYSPLLKPLVVRVNRDEKFLKALKVELEIFCGELESVVAKLKEK